MKSILRISTKHQFYMIEQPSHTVVVASRFEEHTRTENSTFILHDWVPAFSLFSFCTRHCSKRSKSWKVFVQFTDAFLDAHTFYNKNSLGLGHSNLHPDYCKHVPGQERVNRLLTSRILPRDCHPQPTNGSQTRFQLQGESPLPGSAGRYRPWKGRDGWC